MNMADFSAAFQARSRVPLCLGHSEIHNCCPLSFKWHDFCFILGDVPSRRRHIMNFSAGPKLWKTSLNCHSFIAQMAALEGQTDCWKISKWTRHRILTPIFSDFENTHLQIRELCRITQNHFSVVITASLNDHTPCRNAKFTWVTGWTKSLHPTQCVHNLVEDDLTAQLRAAAESRTKQWMSSFFRGNERHFSETQIDRGFLGPLLSSLNLRIRVLQWLKVVPHKVWPNTHALVMRNVTAILTQTRV